jgi:NADPH-dependent curcumin reductase CurA
MEALRRSRASLINGRMEGLLAKDYADRFPEAAEALLGWLRSGELHPK